MHEVEPLHTATRRYAAERAAEWENRYSDLRAEEEQSRQREGLPEPTTYTYSSEALATFPRYQVLHAMQAAVEAFTPADLGSLDEARELLAKAGVEAQSIFTRPPVGEVEQRAMDEERELFAQYVRGLSDEELASIEPLPFRRTLTKAESGRLWAELKNRWGVEGYWYPLDRTPDAEPPPLVRRSTPTRSSTRNFSSNFAKPSPTLVCPACGSSASSRRTQTRRSTLRCLSPFTPVQRATGQTPPWIGWCTRRTRVR